MRTSYKSFLFIICYLILAPFNTVKAQNFEIISNKEGFNQNSINAIAQDRYGFLWYGTPNGLIRYDGYEFKTFTKLLNTNGEIISNVITYLYNDSNGILWIGTSKGISVYIPWIEKFYNIPLNTETYINKITSDSKGRVWFSGYHQLFFCEPINIEKGTFKVSNNIIESYLNNITINDFNLNEDNSIILATSDGLKNLLYKTNSNTNLLKEVLVSSFTAIQNEVNTIHIDTKNILWIGTKEGILKTTLEANRIHILRAYGDYKTKGFSNNPLMINTFFEDNLGVIWVGTKNDGLFKYQQEQDYFEHFSYKPKNKSGLSSKYIKALHQDDYNVLWIGTAHGSINKFDLNQKNFISYSKNPFDQQSISDNLITSILEDSKGRLWISGYDKPLIRSENPVSEHNIDKLKFKNLENQISIPNNDIVRCIYEDDKGFIWLGTDYNVIIYNPKKDSFKKVFLKGIETDLENTTRCIYQMDNDRMLLLGNYIAVLENPWEEIQKSSRPHLDIKSVIDYKPERVQCILKDSKNSFWVGTSNGLSYITFKGKDIIINQEYTDNNESQPQLSNNNIFTLHKSNNDNLWVGTFGGGLNKMYLNNERIPTKIEYFRKNDVLPDDAIYGILQVDESHLWLSTDMGIAKFNVKDETTSIFDVRDGLTHNNFRESAYAKSKTGYFYFGGLNGLTIFNPKDIKLNTQPPKILISHLLINNQPIKIGEKIKNRIVLNKSISETESITINQNQQIAFNVVVQHNSTPSKNRLAYKLEGFNDEWIEKKSGKETITYTNLSAGDYVLRVKAANGDGVWTETTKNLNIEILPPWYNTWWSYLLLTLGVILASLGITIYFVQHEKLKQRLKYETLDKERIEIVNQGKFRYFTNLSHEFRTPLTLISGPLEEMMNYNSDSKNNKYLALIQKNTKRLLSLVDQLITFRQAEQGHVYLNLTKTTLGDFIYPITEAFENYAIERNINFFYKVSSPNEEIIIDIEKFERIIFNLLSNSFKNTPIQGDISIEAKVNFDSDKKMIEIDVIDTGKGIPKKNLENIFERFYQLGNEDGNISGGGIGLAFCKSLVGLFEGRIKATSIPNIETRFSVIIPSKVIENEDYDENEDSKKSFIKDWIPLSSDVINNDNVTNNVKDSKQYSLLVVENEIDVQNFIRSTLSKTYNIEIANNGVDALEKIKLNMPDLIVSDVMMPEMDGYELCEKIKSNSETCHLPVILLTALGGKDSLIKGLEFGADEYISKPFSLKHLELRIAKLIQYKIQIKEYFLKSSKIPKGDKNIKMSKRDEAFLEKMIDIIEKNLSNSNFGVEELSKEIGFSTTHFYRRLKQLTGQVPSVYLRNFRLQRASELLKSNEGFNVSEVMYQIGIESSSYFSTSFKKLYGFTPSEYSKTN